MIEHMADPEREMEKLREDREASARDYITLHAEVTRLREENARLALDLATERGELRNLREENARLKAEIGHSGSPPAEGSWIQRNALLTRERDEARAEVKQLRAERGDFCPTHGYEWWPGCCGVKP